MRLRPYQSIRKWTVGPGTDTREQTKRRRCAHAASTVRGSISLGRRSARDEWRNLPGAGRPLLGDHTATPSGGGGGGGGGGGPPPPGGGEPRGAGRRRGPT